MQSWTATVVGDSVTGTSKVYKRNQQDWTDILLLTSKLIILVLQDQPNKIVFFLRDAFNISFKLCMNYPFNVNACNQQFYVCKESQYKDSWNALKSFWFQEKNNLIDLIENYKRHALIGEVLIIRKLKCKNRGQYKFCPGLAFIDFVQLCHNV